jgi:cell division protein FtsI (penicillin-binding protein 3)
VTNPQIVVAVTLHDTKNGNAGFGGPVAGPVFSKVAMTALRMLDVPKDLPDSFLASTDVNDSSIADLVSSIPLPPVQADSSAAAEEPTQSMNRRPFLTSALVGPKVPDFRGMTLRAVLEESAATGVQIEVSGNGLARNQAPAAGSILGPGVRVRVQFTR